MKTSSCKNRQRGFTLVELLVIMAVITILACMLLPAGSRDRARPHRIQCVNNLKQIGEADRVWEGGHGDKYPFNISKTNGGTIEFTAGAGEFRHFQVMSNELSTPKILICSAESDRMRRFAANFAAFGNSNLSYFIGLDVTETDPQGVLCGDRNLTNGTPIRNGILELTKNTPAGWTAELHNKVGNVLLSDGSVQQLSITGLRSAVANTGTFTNRLQMPILNP